MIKGSNVFVKKISEKSFKIMHFQQNSLEDTLFRRERHKGESQIISSVQ